MSENPKNIVALILAAGESRRMGKPKQILKYGSTTMLNHIKEHLTLKFVDRTFIVLGAYAKEIVQVSNLHDSEIIEFKGWKEGMGSSLAYACGKILSENKYDGILITLSDLPLVSNDDYGKMIELFESENDIVATKANDSVGVPAIFGREYFEELKILKGEKGAKSIIKKHPNKVIMFENEKAAFDVDTVSDFEKLQ